MIAWLPHKIPRLFYLHLRSQFDCVAVTSALRQFRRSRQKFRIDLRTRQEFPGYVRPVPGKKNDWSRRTAAAAQWQLRNSRQAWVSPEKVCAGWQAHQAIFADYRFALCRKIRRWWNRKTTAPCDPQYFAQTGNSSGRWWPHKHRGTR